MPRYKLTIEYDGTPFIGWQLQGSGVSVQGVLTDAVEAFTGERVVVAGAGRTDTGVHALGQVAHIDLSKDWVVDNVRDAMNFHLRPRLVSVLAAEQVAGDFDARFSAIQAPLSLPDRQPPRRSDAGTHSRLARAATARHRQDARGRAAVDRQA